MSDKKNILSLMGLALIGAGIITPTEALAKKADTDPALIVYPQKKTPQSLDAYEFSSYYHNGREAYNSKSRRIAKTSSPIEQMSISPKGDVFALLEKNKNGESKITVWDLWKSNSRIKDLSKIKDKALARQLAQALSIAFTPDGGSLVVALPGELLLLDPYTGTPSNTFSVYGNAPTMLTVSPNGYFLAGTEGDNVTVWSTVDGSQRKRFEMGVPVESVAFSNGSDAFGIMTSDGTLSLYDTAAFLTLGSIDGLGEGRDFSFNADDKYVSSVAGDARIAVVNRMDDSDRQYVDSDQGGIRHARFVKDNQGRNYLAYQTDRTIVYRLMDELAPNLNKLLADELQEMMAEWEKQMPGETLEAYNLRMSEENRMAQMRLFETEIATRMADNLVAMSQVSFGDYNPETGALTLTFDKMSPVYLTVPKDELMDFMDTADLEFRNARYGLTPQDKFDLVYAEVYNRKSGKTYTFDNMKRESLAFLKEEEAFMPLELAQQSAMEEMQLVQLNKAVYEDAKKKNIISDHTRMDVSSRIVPAVNDEGKRIMNYEVSFAYEVDPAFSAKEDFAPGQYEAAKSPAANAMLSVITQALANDFAQYVKPGQKVLVKITGMADALPIRRPLKYNGAYGDLVEVPVTINGQQSLLTVTQAKGIANNDQLALVRATGVKEYIDSNAGDLGKMDRDYTYNLEVASDDKGGAYRRIKVDFIFVDAVK